MPINKPRQSNTRRFVSKQAIRRAVASSTAIETGQSVKATEHKLSARVGTYRGVGVAK